MFDGNDGHQSFADIFPGQVRLIVFEEADFAAVVIDNPGQRALKPPHACRLHSVGYYWRKSIYFR